LATFRPKRKQKGKVCCRFRDICAQVTIPTNAQQQSIPSLEEHADVSGAIAVAVELAIAQPAELAENHLK
jgi:hypothetical protein